MYVNPNYKTKKAVKNAITCGEEVLIFQPNDIFNTPIPKDGTVYLEGPHYPAPHTWYATGTMRGGKLIKIK